MSNLFSSAVVSNNFVLFEVFAAICEDGNLTTPHYSDVFLVQNMSRQTLRLVYLECH